ncbi:helix-turn-helix domain-containing protein [Chryseobacterium sp. MA9]|uniref:helix-turn-helix domain-containing protein n=1 Tax=Chryseobacterium sp. MA9 TaxID=2966625 RepID=UPI00210722C9|nr:helix-turn-helix domain-containing protein [Chryseobacterium sp. MA9]UTX46672.1 helix-turn-helix domain-containing protein [Chryseobacterium sp. MA9]
MEYFKDFFNKIEELIAQKLEKFEEQFSKSKNGEEIKEIMTREETARYFGVSVGTLHNWSKNGTLESINFGGRVYYTKDEILTKLKQAS